MRLDKFKRMQKDPQLQLTLELMLERFLAIQDIKDRLQPNYSLDPFRTWQLPFGSTPLQRAHNGALLIGDAGAFINPLTGGGMHSSLHSAHIAAEVITDAVRQPTSNPDQILPYSQLKAFDQRVREEIIPGMKRSHTIAILMDNYPVLTDLAVLAGNLLPIAQIFRGKL